MHRVHHAAEATEFNFNLGGLFSWWDRLFGYYIAAPRCGHENMVIGIPAYADDKFNSPWQMLLDPLSPHTEFKDVLEPALANAEQHTPTKTNPSVPSE